MRFDDDEGQGVNRPRVPDPLRHPPGVKGAARRYADGLQPSLTPTGHRSSWHLSGGTGADWRLSVEDLDGLRRHLDPEGQPWM